MQRNNKEQIDGRKLSAGFLILLLSLSACVYQSASARGGGAGHSGGGGHSGGAGHIGGGGGHSFSYSHPPSSAGKEHFYNDGYRYRNYRNYGYDNYGGLGGYYNPNQDIYNQAPPYAQDDPLADYYRQQQITSEMAQQGTAQTSVTSMVMPSQQQQLPTDFGGVPVRSMTAHSAECITVDQGNMVRDNFHGSGLFKSGWWKSYKDAWYNPVWKDDFVWNYVDWDTLAAFWRESPAQPPADYEFGNNITFQAGKVYYGDQPMMTTAEYYHQAQLLAAKGTDPPNAKVHAAPPAVKDWAPLGIFSLVHAGEKFSTVLFQLAVDRQGKLRGNCYNIMNDQIDTVQGQVDKTNSRVCWSVGKNRAIIYDSGLGNLLSAQSPLMMHFDKDRAQEYSLVRLNQAKL